MKNPFNRRRDNDTGKYNDEHRDMLGDQIEREMEKYEAERTSGLVTGSLPSLNMERTASRRGDNEQ